MFKKLCLIISSLSVASLCIANTQAFVHTNRKAKVENASKLYASNDLAPAKGLIIETEEGQKVSLVLSSKVVIDVAGKSKLIIEDATQELPITYEKDKPYELKKSTTSIKVEYGKVYLKIPELRPTSSFKLLSPLGEYTLDCKYFSIEVKPESDDVLIYEGYASFTDSKSKFKLNDAYISRIEKSSSGLKLNAKRAILEDGFSFEEQFEITNFIYETTRFDTTNGLNTQRVLTKKLLKAIPLNNYHTN